MSLNNRTYCNSVGVTHRMSLNNRTYCNGMRVTHRMSLDNRTYSNGMEVLLQPFLALAALQGCHSQIDQATLERQFESPLCKAEHAVLGGLAGLLGQPMQLPGQCLPAQEPAQLRTACQECTQAGLVPAMLARLPFAKLESCKRGVLGCLASLC